MLRKETLTPLAPDELARVAGGLSGACLSGMQCISNAAISLCGCPTGYCSFDVC
jgi:hypothetical protein